MNNAGYDYPLILSLRPRREGEPVFAWLEWGPKVRADRDPAAIPPSTFVLALVAVLSRWRDTAIPMRLTLQDLRQRIVDFPSEQQVPLHLDKGEKDMLLALLDDVSSASFSPPGAAANLAVAAASIGLSQPVTFDSTATLDSLNAGKKRLEQWYTDALDRATGAYKRKTQIYLIVWALGLSVLLNADTFRMARTLFEPKQRLAFVTAARGVGSSLAPGDASRQTLDQILPKVKDLELPLGWPELKWSNLNPLSAIFWKTLWSAFFWKKLLGLLITTVAVGQGAPFWFDVLSRFANLRLVGPVRNGTSKNQARAA